MRSVSQRSRIPSTDVSGFYSGRFWRSRGLGGRGPRGSGMFTGRRCAPKLDALTKVGVGVRLSEFMWLMLLYQQRSYTVSDNQKQTAERRWLCRLGHRGSSYHAGIGADERTGSAANYQTTRFIRISVCFFLIQLIHLASKSNSLLRFLSSWRYRANWKVRNQHEEQGMGINIYTWLYFQLFI